MSHNLKIVTKRWNRLCQCNAGQVQTEHHIMLECQLTNQPRRRFAYLINFEDLNILLGDEIHLNDLCKYVYETGKIYKDEAKKKRKIYINVFTVFPEV